MQKSQGHFRIMALAAALFAMFPFADRASAEDGVSKDAFTIFNPTPDALLRPFNSDRPDVTESPYTVDAGHIQFEVGFLQYSYDKEGGSHTNSFEILSTNFRVGLTNSVDFELILNPYDISRTRQNGLHSRTQGFGDMQLRSLINIWGNDGGSTAFGIMPILQLPTGYGGNSTDHVEGGVALPFSAELPQEFDFGAMAEFNIDRNEANDGYGVDVVHTLTVSRSILSTMEAYVEYAGSSSIKTDYTYQAYADTGLTYEVVENVQLDVGIMIGLSSDTDDFTALTGISFRL